MIQIDPDANKKLRDSLRAGRSIEDLRPYFSQDFHLLETCDIYMRRLIEWQSSSSPSNAVVVSAASAVLSVLDDLEAGDALGEGQSSEGKKYDNAKPRPALIPMDALMEVARVLSFGAAKYGEYNWQLVRPTARYSDALMRHVMAYVGGERCDPETGMHHLAHAATNSLFLIWFDFRESDEQR